VSPFKQHAVLVSIYLFIALVYLLDKAVKGISFYNKPLHFLLLFYFTCCLLLLSSKLVITFSAGCLAYYFFLIFKAKLNNRFILVILLFAGLVAILLVLTTQNRISKRFNEIMSGDLRLVEQQHFNPGIYFNGLQFRLLQGRFVKEILTEHHAWLTGVSGEAQTLLDKKYISTHMYTGDRSTGDRGYLGYNTHDQFLQSLLQSGIPGLVVFILICFAMIHLAIRWKNRELTIIVLLLIAWCFNESIFEIQYGLMLFTFFPLFLYYGMEESM
jgi:O-antigen ligase